MAELVSRLNLRVIGGKVTPTPAIASSLGPKGVNLMQFCKKCNDVTASYAGRCVRVVVKLFSDKSFEVISKGVRLTDLIKSAAGIKKGATHPGKESVAVVDSCKIKEIACDIRAFVNARDLPDVISMVEGTMRSMGIKVKKADLL